MDYKTSLPDFCCPKCKGSLNRTEGEYRCLTCAKKYPVVLGIPDFRIFPDPYIDYEDDYEKGEYLFERYHRLDFEGLVRLYWEITPGVSRERAERFMRRTFSLVDKSAECLRELEALIAERRRGPFGSVLEIGCGTGAFLLAAKQKYDHVIGVDIAFRWLIIARKRLEEAGINLPLVCCCAEYMPFRDQSFDCILADRVIEHVKDQEAVLMECHRVSTRDATLFLATPNRLSITSEPHVCLFGVGLLPRRWMKGYVRLIRGIAYEHIKLLSFRELKRLLRKCRFEDHRVMLPSISEREARRFSIAERIQLAIYNLIKGMPVIRRSLYIIGPAFNVVAFAHKNQPGMVRSECE